MGKQSKKKKLKALKYEVTALRTLLNDVVSYMGYEPGQERKPVKVKSIEPYEEFQKKLKETEAKYALKVS